MRHSDDDNWHTIPINDWIEHETTEDCPCGPQVEIITHDDAPDSHMYYHAALDGREIIERGETIPEEG